MAQLLSPVCMESILKFRSATSSSLCSGDRWRSLAGNRRRRIHHLSRSCRRWWRRRRDVRIAATAQESMSQAEIADDYYEVLGLLPDATPQQIKKAYYNCMKACHPDLSGNGPEVTNFCMFINEVYTVLSDPVQRMVYDEIHGYALTAINPFLDDSAQKDQAFVDEFSCIGCKNCANVAPGVFRIEEDFGRARACSQYGDTDLVQQAIDSCPVDCIHWTSGAQLSLLEDEMRRVERVNVGVTCFSDPANLQKVFSEYDGNLVGLMLAGMGGSSIDIFRMASLRWEKRQLKVLEKVKRRMVKQKDSEKNGSWSDLWGKPKNNRNTEEEAKERAKRAAAAARRWREYSRRGTDRPPAFKLPEVLSNKE